MASSGMLHRVALVRTDVSEELSVSFIRVTRSGIRISDPQLQESASHNLLLLCCVRQTNTNSRKLGIPIQLLFTANFIPTSLILVTLMMKAIRSSETLVLT
jgi:hypothetical protein